MFMAWIFRFNSVNNFVLPCKINNIISGLEIIQNYDIVKTSHTLPTEKIPIFTLPSNYPDADKIQPHKVTISKSTIIVITLMNMIVLLTIYRKCRYKSSITSVCFPVYPLSRIVCRKYHTDMFLEVTNTTTCQKIWAHLTKDFHSNYSWATN